MGQIMIENEGLSGTIEKWYESYGFHTWYKYALALKVQNKRKRFEIYASMPEIWAR